MKAVRENRAAPGPRSRAWLWVVAAFAVQAGVWATWFAIAARHPVQEVPLVQRKNGGGPRTDGGPIPSTTDRR